MGLTHLQVNFSKKRLEDLLWVPVTILHWAAMGIALTSSPDTPGTYQVTPHTAPWLGVLCSPHSSEVPSGGGSLFICIPHHTQAGPLCSICLRIISCKGWTESSNTKDYSEPVKVSSVENQVFSLFLWWLTQHTLTHLSPVSERSWGQLSQWEIIWIALSTH